MMILMACTVNYAMNSKIPLNEEQTSALINVKPKEIDGNIQYIVYDSE